MTRVLATRRTGSTAFIGIDQSRDNPDMMFISTPNMVELTRGQVLDLIEALRAEAHNIWGGNIE
ncbi:hypothetical protein CDES_14055 [Corynebacterium deserti GIMN1.010]|uniref:Uncharacterized protein n=1 Tax=Corynebacterium deserti GIMN1.010 TaxID=931089 RepID=A0A0M5IJJ0_9CORY|nr:hypothetical protein [Corynebacterium deserti]ALC07136.1 hypothetical protein CDES_14055 [Corynebacterium deserti GIMN1.010]